MVQENVSILYGTIDSSENEKLEIKLKDHCQTAKYKYLRGIPTKDYNSKITCNPHLDVCIVVAYPNAESRIDDVNVIKMMLPKKAELELVLNIVI